MTGRWSNAPDSVHEARSEVGTNEASASFVFAVEAVFVAQLPRYWVGQRRSVHVLIVPM